MKRMLLLVAMTAASVIAMDKKEIAPLIEVASTNREVAYLKARNRIVEYGKEVLPILAECATDDTLPWQQQLVARICYERIERKKDIEQLLALNWEAKFNPEEVQTRAGRSYTQKVIQDTLKEFGLWYYYLEPWWKMTDEMTSDKYWSSHWIVNCTDVVKDSSAERIWFLRVCSDLMANPTPSFSIVQLLNRLEFEAPTYKPNADTVLLVLQYRQPSWYEKGDQVGSWFKNILECADSRSADMLKEYAEKWWPSVARTPEFAETLTTVRARSAPPVPEPFRLGVKIIKEGNPDAVDALKSFEAKISPPPQKPRSPAPPNTLPPARTPDFGLNPDGSKRLPPGLIRPSTLLPAPMPETEN